MIQIFHHSFFTQLGVSQYRLTITQMPPRASIFDRNGIQLATNSDCTSAFLMPNRIADQSKIISFLDEQFPSAAQRLRANPDASFLYLKRRLSKEELTSIAEAKLKEIHLLKETSRFYPIPSSAALIGFTDIDNVGRSGIEYCFNEQLAGSATTICLEKDARSGYFYFEKLDTVPGVQSEPVHVTIDSDLQYLVDAHLIDICDKLQAQKAAAIILNPTNGDILALSTAPSHLPHEKSFAIEQTKHAAVTDQHEFGSVMKIFSALAALEEKVVTPYEKIDCKNSTKCLLDGRPITTWSPHGIIPFQDVIAFSNNIGIAQVAKRIGTKLYDHYCALGFGKKIAIGLPAQATGFVPSPSNWSAQSLISLSYGYELSATLLHLAQALTVFAENGSLVTPRLLQSQPISIQKNLYSPESIKVARDIMRRTTERGTGWRARMKGFDIMTKTGSANMLVDGMYNHDKNIYTAMALLEKDSYKRIIVAFVQEPETANAFASTVAVPLVRNIMQKMVIHERII